MLADVQAVLESVEAALPGIGDEAIWLQMSTVGAHDVARRGGQGITPGLVAAWVSHLATASIPARDASWAQ
jgi:hypothetical protein